MVSSKCTYYAPKLLSKYNSSLNMILHNHSTRKEVSMENADSLNSYFASVFTQEDDAKELIFNASSELLWEEQPEEPFDFKGKDIGKENTLEVLTIDEQTVEDYLKLVDPNKSSTPDCIHPRIVKECASGLAARLTCIYQMSINTGTVSDQRKYGSVTPLHKGESRHKAKNYQPIIYNYIIAL